MAKTTTTITGPRVRNRWFDTSRVGGIVFGESLTKQEFKTECDINHILDRLKDGPIQPWANAPTLRHGDFAAAPEDFLAAQLLVKQAEESFRSLPVSTRDRFQHDPMNLLRFVHDPRNLDEARRLGLAKPAPVGPPPAPPTPETPK